MAPLLAVRHLRRPPDAYLSGAADLRAVNPGLAALGVRVVATLLGGYLLWIALRNQPVTRGSRLGWPVEGLFATAGGLAGYGAIRIVTGGGGGEGTTTALFAALGPAEALAAGTAL